MQDEDDSQVYNYVEDVMDKNISANTSGNGDDFEITPSDEEGNALPTTDVTKKLRDEVKKLRSERDEYLVGWQRAKADYVNLQRDSLDKITSSRNLGKEMLFESLLPALDSFDMAMNNKEAWEKVEPAWRNGIEYIYNHITSALLDSGITKIGVIGEAFDPTIHEAIETLKTADESQDHTVAEIIQSGYKITDRTIRPARVKIFQK